MEAKRPTAAQAEAASFLVRFWREPRGKADEAPVLRGFVRNLKTGEERYLAGPEQLAEHVRGYLEGLATPSARDAGDRAKLGG